MWNLGSGSAVSAAAGASTRHTHAWTASASSVLQTPFITSPLSALTGLARHGAVSDTRPWHHGPARCSWVGRTGCLPEHVQAVPCSARTRQTQRRPGLTGPSGERLLAACHRPCLGQPQRPPPHCCPPCATAGVRAGADASGSVPPVKRELIGTRGTAGTGCALLLLAASPKHARAPGLPCVRDFVRTAFCLAVSSDTSASPRRANRSLFSSCILQVQAFLLTAGKIGKRNAPESNGRADQARQTVSSASRMGWAKAYAVAFVSLLSGAAVVHNIYQPDLVRSLSKGLLRALFCACLLP